MRSRIVVHGDGVDFETAAGTLSLPRFQEKKHRILPSWEIFLPEGLAETVPFRTGPKLQIRFLIGEQHVLLETPGLVFQTC